mmetsp:Transcript_4639/g.4783  ORF Transcript_4639/g.4783 Transcript_4639/m.4783 type:complete len:81 (-) Transcript_4639:117-359(-)
MWTQQWHQIDPIKSHTQPAKQQLPFSIFSELLPSVIQGKLAVTHQIPQPASQQLHKPAFHSPVGAGDACTLTFMFSGSAT